jgi:hypothetical protein
MALADGRPDTDAMLPFSGIDFLFLALGALVLLQVFLRLRNVSAAQRPRTDY